MMNKLRGSSNLDPDEQSTHWDFFLACDVFPRLSNGDVVLVEYFGRNRTAVVTGKIPGGCYWAKLVAPVNGSTRVIVSKHSLVGVRRGAV